jgi:sulfur-oxidizing protein SoxX
MNKTLLAAIAATLAAAGCAGMMQSAPPAATIEQARAAMKESFAPKGQALLDRIEQDDVQRACSEAQGQPLAPDAARRIEAAQLATIKYPAGSLLGDWKSGERIAQSGVGKQYSDDAAAPVGGNCYACHQLSGQEVAFGTIGPSLRNFGKVRGNTPETQKYVYGKVYNSEAFAACSTMPRFGHNGILSEQQMKDVTALLLDPASPVNQ